MVSDKEEKGVMLLPYDAHNHIQLGPTPLKSVIVNNSNSSGNFFQICLSGMAVMSTHPRDFQSVLQLRQQYPTILPCLGVHPWFLHELTPSDWNLTTPSVSTLTTTQKIPQWVANLEELLIEHPYAPVGEIGLDNFHFDGDKFGKDHIKELTTPLSTQVEALEYQLTLATTYQRPVSLHCVRAIGKIMEVITKVQRINGLPPCIYFHAFAGKAATVTQLIKSYEKSSKKNKQVKSATTTMTKLYFGFAPIINFSSPKTLEVIKTVGLDRLVLETDHEDAAKVPPSMDMGVQVLSEIFGIEPSELISRTNQNARDLYRLDANFLPYTRSTSLSPLTS